MTPAQEKELAAWKKRYPYPMMGLIEAMRQVQEWNRCIRAEDEEFLAKLFDTTAAHVHGVATFFPYFTREPTGKYRVGLCRGLSCAMAGSDKMADRLEKALGVAEGETTADGRFSFETMECLGACDFAPAMIVNERLVGAAAGPLIDQLTAADPDGLKAPGPTPVQAGEKPILTRFDETKAAYKALEKARKMRPEDVVAEIKKSNLRGLGGAGFPTGGKWETVPPLDKAPERFVVCNFDESEPGCFKDRVLGARAPHQLLEGLLIACHAISAKWGFIFIRGEYANQYDVLEAALKEAEKKGVLGEVQVRLMRGAGAYISGLDTALLETMEGKKAWPRQPPPFPTVVGLMGKPTVVNNVETLSMLPHIIENGGEWFAKIGVPPNKENRVNGSGGTGVYSVSGDVERPGVYEFPMGTPLRKIIEAAGGVRGGRKLKAVIPGGTSTPVLSAAEIDVPMDFDSLRGVGSFLGAGGIVVLDETRDMAEVAHNIERFLEHESCGQCTPCREGSAWSVRILERMLEGKGRPADLPNLERVGENITGKVICALGDTVGMVVRPMMKKFPDDFKSKAEKLVHAG